MCYVSFLIEQYLGFLLMGSYGFFLFSLLQVAFEARFGGCCGEWESVSVPEWR